MDLERALNSVGKSIFIKYYDDFKSQNKDKKTLAQKLLNDNNKEKSENAQMTRIYYAYKIFENNMQKQALEIIISSKVSEEIKEKAKKILENEI